MHSCSSMGYLVRSMSQATVDVILKHISQSDLTDYIICLFIVFSQRDEMSDVPAAVQNDSVRLQAYELVLHRNVMKPGGFGIHDECVW